ncbi:hypothetical protein HPP92_007554 [Vanilla planifolia]|uniref:Ariadne domain-containing protein n=1 Tax=Vanilla planifolia TaxID=51239 RepID=A0A835VBY5_VANPL|nr:hypothetical protein HPP92_007554 [Vanilla planifolia]
MVIIKEFNEKSRGLKRARFISTKGFGFSWNREVKGWLCGAATGRDHTWSTITGHSCGRFKEDQTKRIESARRELYRYMHYHNRYKAHIDSLKQESNLKETIQGKIAISENKESRIKDYSWDEWAEQALQIQACSFLFLSICFFLHVWG